MEQKEIEQKEIKANEQNKQEEVILTFKESVNFEPVIVPDGLYDAVFQSYDKIPDGNFGSRLALKFEIEHEGQKKIVDRIVYAKLSESSALYNFVKALGFNGQIGAELHLSDYIGKECQILLKKTQFQKNEKTITKSNIENVLPKKTFN